MNVVTTKERILQYIDYKGITLSLFFKKTGIKRGFLDTDKLKSSVSDVFLTKIIASFPEISIRWLLTGEGDMLIKETYVEHEQESIVSEPHTQYGLDSKELNELYRKYIQELEENKELRKQIEGLKEQLKKTEKDSRKAS